MMLSAHPVEAAADSLPTAAANLRMFYDGMLSNQPVKKEASWKAVGRARQLEYMKTEDFSRYARFRNGAEAIPSLPRRSYAVDKIPAHGKKRTGLHFGFKIAALNFQKLLNYVNSLENYAPKMKTA